MGVCCGQEDPKCWEFSYPGDQDELETDVANTSGVARITFPIIVPKRDLNSPTYDDLLVSLIPPSGVAFLTRRDAGRNQSKEVLMSVFQCLACSHYGAFVLHTGWDCNMDYGMFFDCSCISLFNYCKKALLIGVFSSG